MATNPNPNIDAERVAFEAHFGKRTIDFTMGKNAWGDDTYIRSHVECLWTGWQAHASQAPAPSPAVGSSIDTSVFRNLARLVNGPFADLAIDELITHIDAHCARLASQSASAKDTADAERLDWMEKSLLREASMRFPDGSFKAVNAWSIASAGTNLREAIDAARAKDAP